MIDYGKVRSTVKPDEIVIDEFSVWQHTDIQEISENVGEENEFVGYEFNMVQYDKNEFILKQAKENAELSEQITQTQIALTEVYEKSSKRCPALKLRRNAPSERKPLSESSVAKRYLWIRHNRWQRL